MGCIRDHLSLKFLNKGGAAAHPLVILEEPSLNPLLHELSQVLLHLLRLQLNQSVHEDLQNIVGFDLGRVFARETAILHQVLDVLHFGSRLVFIDLFGEQVPELGLDFLLRSRELIILLRSRLETGRRCVFALLVNALFLTTAARALLVVVLLLHFVNVATLVAFGVLVVALLALIASSSLGLLALPDLRNFDFFLSLHAGILVGLLGPPICLVLEHVLDHQLDAQGYFGVLRA